MLGSGGIVGGAFHAGVLKALLDTWNIDARSVDLIVGTSAGSVAAALTAAGLHPNDLFRREIGKPMSPGGQRLLRTARAKRGPTPVTQSSIGRPMAPEALWRAALRPSGVAPGSLAAALLPRGSASTAHVAGMVDGLLGPWWPARPELRVCTVEVASARRVVFGRGDGATPSAAVAASCAVPAVFSPVAIRGREYYDGGAHSADNLDVIGDDRYDLIVVSSPMSTTRRIDAGRPWSMLRTVSRWQTDQQRGRLSGCGHVEIVRPTVRDLDAMGTNLLDRSRRPAVAVQAHASASARFARRPCPI